MDVRGEPSPLTTAACPPPISVTSCTPLLLPVGPSPVVTSTSPPSTSLHPPERLFVLSLRCLSQGLFFLRCNMACCYSLYRKLLYRAPRKMFRWSGVLLTLPRRALPKSPYCPPRPSKQLWIPLRRPQRFQSSPFHHFLLRRNPLWSNRYRRNFDF